MNRARSRERQTSGKTKKGVSARIQSIIRLFVDPTFLRDCFDIFCGNQTKAAELGVPGTKLRDKQAGANQR